MEKAEEDFKLQQLGLLYRRMRRYPGSRKSRMKEYLNEPNEDQTELIWSGKLAWKSLLWGGGGDLRGKLRGLPRLAFLEGMALGVGRWMRRDGNVTAGGKSGLLQDYDRQRQALTWHPWKKMSLCTSPSLQAEPIMVSTSSS